VPLPRFLIDELARQVIGRSAGDLVFVGERGAVMRSQTFQRAALTEAAETLGIPGFHPHELRHTAASLAIASGADVKVVQQMLGHKSAVMTLDSTATCSAIGSISWPMVWTRHVPRRSCAGTGTASPNCQAATGTRWSSMNRNCTYRGARRCVTDVS
jgi:integrase